METKKNGGVQPTEVSSINRMDGNVNKVFGGARHTYFEMLSFKGFKRWMKTHAGDYRYEGLLDSMIFVEPLGAVYRAAWSIYWSSADASGTIRIISEDESRQYQGAGGVQ